MSSRLRRSRASLLYLLQTNIIVIFLLSVGGSLAFAVSADPPTGRTQIVTIPMTSNFADRINYIDDVNTNTYPDSSHASAYSGSTIPVTSGADGNNQSPNPNNPSIFYGAVTNNNQPLESTSQSQPLESTSQSQPLESTSQSQPLESTSQSQPLESTSMNGVQYVSKNVADDDDSSQLGDLESGPINRGKNVQGDLLQGTGNNDMEFDTIKGTDRSETIMGLQGNDIIYGKGGDDILYGDEDDDLIYGGAGDDLLNGGTGDNKLDGEGRNDILIGGDTADILSGGDGNDKLFGYDGNDALKGGEGSNEFNCGEGIDTVLDYKESRDLLANDCEIVNQG
jgi:Ca2+-binding RTX toxin-like protein